MRRGDEIVAAEQRVLPRRLLDEHIDRGAGDLAAVERGGEVLLDDEPAARAVDDAHAALHLRDRRGVDDVAGRVGQRRVQRDEIGAAQQLVERDALDAEFDGAFRRQERVVGDDAHLQPLRAVGDDRADIAAADDAERLAGQLDPHEARFLPLAGLRRAIGGRDLAGQREHHRDRVLGGGDRVAVGRVHDDDAALGRRRHVDIVDADAGAPDDFQRVRGGEQLGRDLGRRAHRQPVITGDAAAQFGRIEPGRDIGFDAARPENFDRARAESVGDQHLRHLQLLEFSYHEGHKGTRRYAKDVSSPSCPLRAFVRCGIKRHAAFGGVALLFPGPVEPRQQRLDIAALDGRAGPDADARRRGAVAGEIVAGAFGLDAAPSSTARS